MLNPEKICNALQHLVLTRLASTTGIAVHRLTRFRDGDVSKMTITEAQTLSAFIRGLSDE